MNINKQAFKLRGVTVEDYFGWCEKKKIARASSKSMQEFFTRLDDGRLVKDPATGRLLNKRRRKWGVPYAIRWNDYR